MVPGAGMPLSKSPGQRGDLRISFDIRFPARLSEEQKLAARRLLGSGGG